MYSPNGNADYGCWDIILPYQPFFFNYFIYFGVREQIYCVILVNLPRIEPGSLTNEKVSMLPIAPQDVLFVLTGYICSLWSFYVKICVSFNKNKYKIKYGSSMICYLSYLPSCSFNPFNNIASFLSHESTLGLFSLVWRWQFWWQKLL